MIMPVDAFSRRVALRFIKEGNAMLSSALLLQVSLAPETQVMRDVTFTTSQEWEESQMHQFLTTGVRTYRLFLLHQSEAFQKALSQAVFLMQSSSLTIMLGAPETEELRSRIFRAMMRPASVCYQLLIIRCRGNPYQLFRVLDPALIAEEEPDASWKRHLACETVIHKWCWPDFLVLSFWLERRQRASSE